MAARAMILGRKGALSWVFSLLLLLSASGQALAFLLCRDANCPMFSTAQQAPKSCCDSEKEPSKDSCDCCELSALPQMSKGPAKFSLETNSFVLPMVQARDAIQTPQGVLVDRARPAFYHRDHSPPEPGFAPDLGRAPPVV